MGNFADEFKEFTNTDMDFVKFFCSCANAFIWSMSFQDGGLGVDIASAVVDGLVCGALNGWGVWYMWFHNPKWTHWTPEGKRGERSEGLDIISYAANAFADTMIGIIISIVKHNSPNKRRNPFKPPPNVDPDKPYNPDPYNADGNYDFNDM